MPSNLEIVRIPALSDNYVWLVHDPASNETIVVDPSEAAPVLAEAEARGWKISQIWNTHCGRLFEGGPAQMYANMQRLATLPPETIVYCAHEYTQSNGRYAAAAEPDNAAVTERMSDVDAKRAAGEPTVPTTIALELATNPFLRASSAEQLAERRAAKDVF